MNRNNIDFTKCTKLCAICGKDSTEGHLRHVIVSQHGDYTNAKVAICEHCLEFMETTVEDGVIHVESIADVPNTVAHVMDVYLSNCIRDNDSLKYFSDLYQKPASFKVAIDGYMARRESAFNERLTQLNDLIKGYPNRYDTSWQCPVCRTPIKEIHEDLEISTKFIFECECGCCHFTEDDLFKHFGSKIKDSRGGYYSRYDRETESNRYSRERQTHLMVNAILHNFYVSDRYGNNDCAVSEVIKSCAANLAHEQWPRLDMWELKHKNPQSYQSKLDECSKIVIKRMQTKYGLTAGMKLGAHQLAEIYKSTLVDPTTCKWFNAHHPTNKKLANFCSKNCSECRIYDRDLVDSSECKSFDPVKAAEDHIPVPTWMDCKHAKMGMIEDRYGRKFECLICTNPKCELHNCKCEGDANPKSCFPGHNECSRCNGFKTRSDFPTPRKTVVIKKSLD